MLLATTGFVDRGRQAQRLYYKPPGFDVEAIIDVIPFGGLATDGQTIAWPPDQDVVMNVTAFTDVLASAATIQIAESGWIPVASLAGLTVLKLFAWLDRHDSRDAADLQRLMETYADVGNTDRIYESEAKELEGRLRKSWAVDVSYGDRSADQWDTCLESHTLFPLSDCACCF